MHSKLMFPRSIRYLLSVAENHSFTRAAEALHVSQPTLSQQIKLLEEALDAQLLDRSGRTVRLTDAGEVYVRHARRALEELDAAKRAVVDLEDLSRGYLRLGMTPITEYLTTSLVDEFNARYPGIAVSAMEMSQDQIEAGVAEGTLDAGIAFTHATPIEVESSKIEMHTLFMEPLSLAVGADHALAGRQVPMGIEVLSQEPLVMLNQNFALRRHFDLYCIEHGIHPRIAVETNSLSMMVQSVRLGAPDHRVADHHRLHAAAPVCRSPVPRVAPPHDCTDRAARDLQEPGLPRLRQACRRVELWPLADFARPAD
jgi:LysR family cyn operon transcriptional activator